MSQVPGIPPVKYQEDESISLKPERKNDKAEDVAIKSLEGMQTAGPGRTDELLKISSTGVVPQTLSMNEVASKTVKELKNLRTTFRIKKLLSIFSERLSKRFFLSQAGTSFADIEAVEQLITVKEAEKGVRGKKPKELAKILHSTLEVLAHCNDPKVLMACQAIVAQFKGLPKKTGIQLMRILASEGKPLPCPKKADPDLTEFFCVSLAALIQEPEFALSTAVDIKQFMDLNQLLLGLDGEKLLGLDGEKTLTGMFSLQVEKSLQRFLTEEDLSSAKFKRWCDDVPMFAKVTSPGQLQQLSDKFNTLRQPHYFEDVIISFQKAKMALALALAGTESSGLLKSLERVMDERHSLEQKFGPTRQLLQSINPSVFRLFNGGEVNDAADALVLKLESTMIDVEARMDSVGLTLGEFNALDDEIAELDYSSGFEKILEDNKEIQARYFVIRNRFLFIFNRLFPYSQTSGAKSPSGSQKLADSKKPPISEIAPDKPPVDLKEVPGSFSAMQLIARHLDPRTQASLAQVDKTSREAVHQVRREKFGQYLKQKELLQLLPFFLKDPPLKEMSEDRQCERWGSLLDEGELYSLVETRLPLILRGENTLSFYGINCELLSEADRAPFVGKSVKEIVSDPELLSSLLATDYDRNLLIFFALTSRRLEPFQSVSRKERIAEVRKYFKEIEPKIRRITIDGEYGPKLTCIPMEICRLSYLRVLEVSGNSIQVLPFSFGHLRALKRLDLSDNPLMSVPSSIGYLRSLQELCLVSTRLASLPDSILRLRRLVIIAFCTTNLTLPKGGDSCDIELHTRGGGPLW